jgi:hypothetical protein
VKGKTVHALCATMRNASGRGGDMRLNPFRHGWVPQAACGLPVSGHRFEDVIDTSWIGGRGAGAGVGA